MKIKVVLLTIAAALMLSSCTTYDEGPSFTLISAMQRITGTWVLEETRVNDTVVDLNDMAAMLGDVDLDSLTGGFQIDPTQISVTKVNLTFEKDGDGNFYFAVSVMSFPFSRTEFITWSFDDEKQNVSITALEETRDYEIVKLTKTELWLRYTETTDGETTTLFMKFEKEDK
ncbi:MAG: hypothetical protein KA793_08810 [Bacteroidales bacterium]|nr:hypothetical protein [Bacteroidales bacterium]